MLIAPWLAALLATAPGRYFVQLPGLALYFSSLRIVASLSSRSAVQN
jgi:hypothetical protein